MQLDSTIMSQIQRTINSGRRYFSIVFLFSCIITNSQAQQIWHVSDCAGFKSIPVWFWRNSFLTLGGNFTVYRSDDAGKTCASWNPVFHNFLAAPPLHQIQLFDSLAAIVIGDSGFIATSKDGGHSWTQLPCPVTSQLFSVHCAAWGSGIILGRNPACILVWDESGWRIAPFTPYNMDNGTQGFCHTYNNGKTRIVVTQNSIDDSIAKCVTVFTTRNRWNTIDSTRLISWMTADNRFISINLAAAFANDDTVNTGDTMVVCALATPEFGSGHPISLLFRSFDDGAHWTRTVDSSADVQGYINPRVHKKMIISAVRKSGNPYGNYLLRSTDLGESWSLDTVVFDRTVGDAQIALPAFSTDGSLACVFVTGHGNILARQSTASDRVNSYMPDSELQVYPDPATTELHIPSISKAGLFDALGRSYSIPNHDGILNVSSLPAGVYYMSDGKQRARFVKQ